MENRNPTICDLFVETHLHLKRQGPCCSEDVGVLRVLGDIPISHIAVMGCGTGEKAIALAKETGAEVVGVDCIPAFIEALDDSIRKQQLENKVKGIVAEMDDLPFQKEEFDLIWSELPLHDLGFGKGLNFVRALVNWSGFLKKGGHMILGCPTKLCGDEQCGYEELPDEIEAFFNTAGIALDSMEFNSNGMDRLGYDQIVMFSALADEEWTAYFSERAEENEKLLRKYPGNETVLSYVERAKYEELLFSEHNRNEEDYPYYGYNFYVGRKN